MTSHRTVTALLLAALVVTAACGDDSDDAASDASAAQPEAPASASPSGDDPESPYCRRVIERAVEDLTPHDDTDPAQLRIFIDGYVDYLTDAADLAPDEIAADAELSVTGFVEMVLPVLERYDYSVERIATEGTPAEQALSEPPPEIAAAQDRIWEYDASVCASEEPPVTGVTFDGPPSDGYCEAAGALEGAVGEVMGAGADPAALEELLTSEEHAELVAAAAAAAPEEISDDVATSNAFFEERVRPLVERFDYDVRRLLLEGTVEDRAALQSTDPVVRDAFVRTEAYFQQLCAG